MLALQEIKKEFQDEDEDLVQKARNGDMQAFDDLVAKYESPIFNYVLRMISDRDASADLLQEVFLKAYKALPRFRGEASFKTWIYRIATNLCKNRLRDWSRRRKYKIQSLSGQEDDEGTQRPMEIADNNHDPDRVLQREEAQRLARLAIDLLPPLYQKVLVLNDLQELSYAEIADVLAIPRGTVKSRLNRARLMLRENLVSIGYDPY